MDTVNKYFTNFKRGIILLVIYISLGTLIIILKQYNDYNRDLFSSIESKFPPGISDFFILPAFNAFP